jgi:hypothetical protein
MREKKGGEFASGHRAAGFVLSWPTALLAFFLLLLFDLWCERPLWCCLRRVASLAVPPALEPPVYSHLVYILMTKQGEVYHALFLWEFRTPCRPS